MLLLKTFNMKRVEGFYNSNLMLIRMAGSRGRPNQSVKVDFSTLFKLAINLEWAKQRWARIKPMLFQSPGRLRQRFCQHISFHNLETLKLGHRDKDDFQFFCNESNSQKNFFCEIPETQVCNFDFTWIAFFRTCPKSFKSYFTFAGDTSFFIL